MTQIRKEIAAKGGWYYGYHAKVAGDEKVADIASGPDTVVWPQKALAHPFNPNGFSQPMCAQCKKHRLDWFTVNRNMQYVLHEVSSEQQFFNGTRDRGRAGQKLCDFMQAKEAQEAKLTEAEVVGLRYYTSHTFDAINESLRDPQRTGPHKLPAITTCIYNAIMNLRRVDADAACATEEEILWRGFRDMQLTEAFANDGGTEPAPMSTTGDPKVAVGYALRKGQSSESLLFRIKTNNQLQRGVSIQWVSMFPDESETLFPPLTYMQPTGLTQKVRVLSQFRI